jgi:hypothetical protein
MVVFKSRKLKLIRKLKKQRKNKTRHLKNKHNHYTLKHSKHKSYRKTRHYYNARQHIGGAGNITNTTNIQLVRAYDGTIIGMGNEPIYFIGAVAVFFMLVICGCWLYDLRPRNRTREPNVQIELASPRFTHRVETPRLGVTPRLGETPTLGEVCSICLQSMEEGESTKATVPCKHVFHEDCITRWLEFDDSKSCPNCREHVTRLRTIVLKPILSQPKVILEVGESLDSVKNPSYYDHDQDPPVSAGGGGPSILDTIAKLASKVKGGDFQETLAKYFTFLKLSPKDYNTILKLLRNINKANNLEKLIKIVTTKLGFTCYKNIKSTTRKSATRKSATYKSATYDSDIMLVKVLGADVENKIKNIIQNCNMASDLKLKPKMVTDVKHIRNILGKTLINYISDPTLKQNKKDLLSNLQGASNKLNA